MFLELEYNFREREDKLSYEEEKSEKKNISINKEEYPFNFKYNTTITSDLFTRNFYNNRACIFTYSKDNNVYVAYGVKNTFDLECYNALYDKKFIIIKELHKQSFDSCRYFYDELQNIDLIITASLDSHVKVINFLKENSEIILDLNFETNTATKKIINTAYYIHQCVLVPFSNVKKGKVDFYRIKYDIFKTHSFIGGIRENAGFILGLSHYFNEKRRVHYALIANKDGIFAYCIDNLKFPELYHKFIPDLDEEEKKKNCFGEAFVIEKGDSVILIGPSFTYGYLFFWDFFKGDLLHLMKLVSGISDICLWDNNYLFASLYKSTSQLF